MSKYWEYKNMAFSFSTDCDCEVIKMCDFEQARKLLIASACLSTITDVWQNLFEVKFAFLDVFYISNIALSDILQQAFENMQMKKQVNLA